MPWWGVLSAAASPVVLIGGWTVAAKLQPSFNQMTQTVSDLAALGATDRWVMTLVFVATGACYLVTGVALRPAAPAGRLTLIAGAIAGMLVAAYPEHPGSGSVPHTLWASLGFAGLAAWPAAAARRGPTVPSAPPPSAPLPVPPPTPPTVPPVPWALRPAVCRAVVAVQFMLLIWFTAELITGAGQVGLAERVAGGTQALWPLVVVLSCRATAAAVTPPAAAVTPPAGSGGAGRRGPGG